MAKQLYWEDVKEGDEVTPLSQVFTSQTLVRFAGGGGDFNPLHYELQFAQANLQERPIVHGQFKRAVLVHLMTDWAGDQGRIKKLSCQFRGVDLPRLMKSMGEPQDGETWTAKGKVTGKRVEDGEHLIDCDIGLENEQGQVTTPGKATVVLPSRGA